MANENWSAVAIAVVGLVGTVTAGVIGYQNGTNAVEKDYVQIAIGTLEKKDASPELRRWSVDVLSKLSPVPFGKKLEDQLTEGRAFMAAVYIPPIKIEGGMAEQCPDMLQSEWARKEWVSGEKIVDLMKEYELCRSRHKHTLQLIDELNKFAAKSNRDQGLFSDQAKAAAAK